MNFMQNETDNGSSVAKTHELVSRLRAGEIERFRELYERIAPSLCAWARVRSDPAQGFVLDPEDLLQEVWLRAFENLADFDEARGSFRSWVFGIAKHVALDAWRKGERAAVSMRSEAPPGSMALDSWPDVATSIRSRLAKDESTRLLMEHIAGFDPVDRTMLVHCGMEGVPCTVVATRLGMNAETAKKRWQRLRVRLAEHSFAELLEL